MQQQQCKLGSFTACLAPSLSLRAMQDSWLNDRCWPALIMLFSPLLLQLLFPWILFVLPASYPTNLDHL